MYPLAFSWFEARRHTDPKLVPPEGLEPPLANYLLHTGYKSAVLPLNYRGNLGAEYRVRTDDLDVGNVALYQLS